MGTIQGTVHDNPVRVDRAVRFAQLSLRLHGVVAAFHRSRAGSFAISRGRRSVSAITENGASIRNTRVRSIETGKLARYDVPSFSLATPGSSHAHLMASASPVTPEYGCPIWESAANLLCTDMQPNKETDAIASSNTPLIRCF